MVALHTLAEQVEHYKTNLNAGHYIKTNHHSLQPSAKTAHSCEGWSFTNCHVADLADFSSSSEG